MDSRRFDNWTRNRALRLSRRDALRLAGASAGAAALAAHVPDTTAATACTLTLQGEILGAPSESTSYKGHLTFTIGSDGVISQGSFTPTGGSPATVVGSLTGRAIDLLITLGNDRVLTLTGAAARTGTACPTVAAGVLTGPDPGDLGAWQAAGNAATIPPSNPAQPTSTPTTPSGSSCIAPSFPCGPNCCPAGTTCTDTSQGICGCPGGTTQCGNSCVPNCPNDQTLDLDRCSCVSTCSPDQTSCQFDFECCNGACLNGACGSCPGLLCGDMGCVDQSSDPNNCGSCGVVCGADTPLCQGGVCQCIPDGQPVGSSSSSCCSAGMVKPDGTCGCSQLREACSSVSQCCDNASSGAVCVFGKTGPEVCCFWTSGVCGSDEDCCFDLTCVGGACVDQT